MKWDGGGGTGDRGGGRGARGWGRAGGGGAAGGGGGAAGGVRPQPVEVGPRGEGVTVAAVVAQEAVFPPQVGADAGGDGFLPHVGVNQAGDGAALEVLDAAFLEAANGEHGPVELEQFLVRYVHVGGFLSAGIALMVAESAEEFKKEGEI